MYRWLILGLIVIANCSAHAEIMPEQTPLILSAEVVETHLETRVDPDYPPQAIAAHIAGDVVLHIEIGRGGLVARAYVLNGPEILRDAAKIAVEHWIYRPFIDNHFLVLAESTVIVRFYLPGVLPPADEKLTDGFFPALDRCSGLSRYHLEPDEAAHVCRDAAELADHFQPTSHYLERSKAADLYAEALLAVGRDEEALSYANKAIAIVQQGPGDDLESSAVFFTRAKIQLNLGDYYRADEDMDKAEASLKKVLGPAVEAGGEALYRFQMRMMLLFHAHLFSVWGKPEKESEMMDAAMNI